MMSNIQFSLDKRRADPRIVDFLKARFLTRDIKAKEIWLL